MDIITQEILIPTVTAAIVGGGVGLVAGHGSDGKMVKCILIGVLIGSVLGATLGVALASPLLEHNPS